MRFGVPILSWARRLPVIAVAGLLALGVVVTPWPAGLAVAQSTDPAAPDLQFPREEDLATDRGLALSVTPAAPPDVIEVEPAVAEADAAFAAFTQDDWEVEPLVAHLGTEPEAAFTFVRDHIALDAYPGMLRGAQGTLAARAGNAYDRALLLKALLEAQGHTTRLALADLDPGTAGQLLERVGAPVPEPLQSAAGLVLGPELREAIGLRARRDYALLREALDPHLASAPGAPADGLTAILAHHAWVQVQDGAAWVDYDPSLPEAQVGEALVPAGRFYDEVLPIDRQAVTLRLVVETLADGWLSEAPVLEQRLDAADAADRQLLLLFQPGEGGGGGLFDAVGTATTFTPALLVDGTAAMGAPFEAVPAEGGGGFADFGGFGGGAAGELVGLYLDVVISVPGQPEEVHRRVLLDRVPPAARLADVVTPELLAPMAADDAGPLVLQAAHHIMVSTGGSDPRAHAWEQAEAAWFAGTELAALDAAERYPVDDLLWPLTVSDETLVVASEHAVAGPLSAAVPGTRVFVGSPRVYVASLVPDPDAPAGIVFETDLLVDDIEVAATVISPESARLGLWYGALQSALETELAIRLAPALAAGADGIDSASLRDPGGGLTVQLPSDAGSLSKDAPTALRRAFEQGRIVLPMGEAVPRAWWSVDPANGVARSVVDPGLGMSKVGGRPPLVPPASPGGGAGQEPPGGGPKPQPKPNPPVIPDPKPRPKPLFPDTFEQGPRVGVRPTGKEEGAVTNAVAIPATAFLRTYSGQLLAVVLTGIAVNVAMESWS